MIFRSLLAVATLAALCTVPATASAAAPATVRLPAPTGADPIGTTAVHLVDPSRPDPWVPSEKHRELMVSIWYPAATSSCRARAPQMLAKAAQHFATTDAEQTYSIPAGTIDFGATRTHACPDAKPAPGRRAVVLYSPGLGDPRTWSTSLVEDLASHGFVVVTIDHTHDASEVQFPGGRLLTWAPLIKAVRTSHDIVKVLRKIVAVRVADTRFVLDQLQSGRLPLSGHMNLNRVGMFGHSAGGFEALETEREDSRLRVGVDMDGTVGFGQEDTDPGLSPLARHGLNRPFLLMGSASNDHYTSTSWSALWQHSHGWHRDLHFGGAEHASFTDAESFLPQVADALGPGTVEQVDGWAPHATVVAAERKYLLAFFDYWLRDGSGNAFDRPGTPYPNIRFVQ